MESPIILPFKGMLPVIHPSAWVAPGAVVVGDVVIEEASSVWFAAVVRGDVNYIRIGRRSNVQDGVTVHVNAGDCPVVIEDEVTIGHGAIVHGCTLRDGCLIGIGARILDRVEIGAESLIASGSVVREGTIVPPGELWAGVPAIKKRDLSPEQRRELRESAAHYVEYRTYYMQLEAPVRNL